MHFPEVFKVKASWDSDIPFGRGREQRPARGRERAGWPKVPLARVYSFFYAGVEEILLIGRG
jgi:hypothetical protein